MPSWTLNELSVVKDLLREAELLQPTSSEVVVQIAVGGDSDFRVDGSLKVHAALSHPGVIVSMETAKMGTLSMACDRWRTRSGNQWNKSDCLANIRAVTLTLTALRAIERYGIGTGTEQYRGWAAIGPGSIELGPGKMSRTEAMKTMAESLGLPADAYVQFTNPVLVNEEAFKRLVQARDILLAS